ncbi:MAG: S28 family serine protease, partial [Acidobacteriota bacterium]
MKRLLGLLVALGACGDNTPPPDILVALQHLPDVADATEMPTSNAGYRYLVVHFIEPVDHADPASPTFLVEASLLHKSYEAPLVVHTSGYSDYYHDSVVELTHLLAANQISIEHRYFGTSRPEPADWTKLTIEQMADDEHDIVTSLRTLYRGAAITTGGSKGGMTAVFYRRFFPDDVDGTVPYVAPISFGEPDPRYPSYIATLGPAACHQAVEDLAVEMLAHRRAALEQAAQAQAVTSGYSYTRVALGPAVETAVEGLEWSFWQYYGIQACGSVPATTDT